jgi:hypothetical protein
MTELVCRLTGFPGGLGRLEEELSPRVGLVEHGGDCFARVGVERDPRPGDALGAAGEEHVAGGCIYGLRQRFVVEHHPPGGLDRLVRVLPAADRERRLIGRADRVQVFPIWYLDQRVREAVFGLEQRSPRRLPLLGVEQVVARDGDGAGQLGGHGIQRVGRLTSNS